MKWKNQNIDGGGRAEQTIIETIQKKQLIWFGHDRKWQRESCHGIMDIFQKKEINDLEYHGRRY